MKEGHEPTRGDWNGDHQEWIDFTRPITGGPTEHGFDHFFGIIGSLDMPPYVYVEDDRPVAPSPEFLGSSGISLYADFCREVDARVGEVLAALEASGFGDKTLVVFTADNGAAAKVAEADALERHYYHFCSERFRGYKSDAWDGGHRVPFLARWPEGIAAGSTCNQPFGIFDLLPTAAELAGHQLEEDEGVDAVSLLPAFRGEAIPEDARDCLIHHSIKGRFAIRKGKWKLCRCPGSGGWTFPDEEARAAGLPEVQLYDMSVDGAERNNVAGEHPEVVSELTRRLHQAIIRGRTTPGPRQSVPGSLSDWKQVDWTAELPQRFLVDD